LNVDLVVNSDVVEQSGLGEFMSEERPIRRLLEGVRRFHDNEFPRDHSIFEHLASGQHPHTLFITCADSRIVPELITQTAPGELFVCRNIGNIVPIYGESSCEVAAVIEYACIQLRVSEIVVCGHSDCGAMKALQMPPTEEHMPAVASWLSNAAEVRDVVQASHPDGLEGPEAVQALVEQNVRAQLANLRTHPAVAARIAENSIEMHGWVYDIGAGIIGILDAKNREFLPMESVLTQLR
jgi:carbonic anhydrase